MKKIILTLTVAITALSALIAASSCTKEHEHTFSETWSYNETRHWKDATCEHVEITQSNGIHSLGLWSEASAPTCEKKGVLHRICTVCGYEETRETDKVDHTYAAVYSMNDTYHWFAATCSHTDQTKGKEEHTFANGERTCSVCGFVDTKPQNAELQAPGFKAVSASKFELSVPNATDEYSFASAFRIAKEASYTVFTDKKCTEEVEFSTIPLLEGDNEFFVRVQNGIDKETYTVLIHRNILFTVTFDAAGGPEVEAQEVEEKHVAEEPEAITREGYAFVSWDFDFSNPVTENITVTAIWSPNVYTVSLDPAEGECTSSLVVTYGEDYVLPTPTRTGYTFSGWYNGNDKFENGNWTRLTDLALTARWTVITSNITLHNDKGSFDGITENADYDAVLSLPEPTSDGYTFAGWYLGETKMEIGSIWKIVEDVSLSAKWTANSYRVTFNANEGDCDLSELSIVFDEEISLPTPTKLGYVFLGWFDGENEISDGAWTIAADTALTAHWTINTNTLYTVNHYRQNPTGNGYVLYETELLYGTAFSSVTPALKTYDHFSATQSAAAVDIAPDGTLTVNYYYDRETVVLTFVTNNGESPVEKAVPYECPAGAAFTPKRTGVTFGGWYTDAALTTPATALTAGQTLYAYWEGETKPTDFTYSISGGKATLTAFSGKQANVVIPAYINDCPVTTIGTNCFYVNESYRTMKNVTLPETLANIGCGAFDYCKLDTVNVRDLAAYCAVNIYSDKVLLNHTNAFCVNGVAVKDLVIPEGATSIGEFAFSGNGLFTSVSFPKSLKSIGEFAFYRCTSLKTVSFARESQCQTIHRYAFSDCSSLTSVVIPSSVTKCYGDAFDSCSKVTVYCRISKKPDTGWLGNFWTSATSPIVWDYSTTSYRVEYYLQDLEPDIYTLISSETYKGDEINTATPEVFTYTGFKSPNVRTVDIVEDTLTVIQYFYERNSYTVTFDAGEETVAPITVKYGENVTLPSPNPVTGHSYAWYDGDTKVENGAWLFTEDKTLKVKWSVDTYTLNFDADGGTCAQSSMTVTYGKSFALPVLTRTGYEFLGWYEGETKIEDGIYTATAGKDLKAKWSIITYTVSLDADGGTCAVTSFDINYGSAFTLPDVTRTGYIFNGWFDGTAEVKGGTWSYDSDKTLKAKWTIIQNILSFNANEGTCATASMTVTYFESYELPTPTRKGYSFLGWYDGETKLENGTWASDTDRALTAKWDHPLFCVSFVTNGGNDIADASLYYGTTLSAYVPTRDDFTFGGWYTEKTLKTKITEVPESAVTLYAKWNEETSPASFTYTIGEDSVSIDKFLGSDTAVVVPAYIGGKPVAVIGEYAFQNCNSLQSFTLPASVVSIGSYAFDYCRTLSTFTFAEGSVCSSIGERAFGNCYALTTITFPDTVTAIGISAFYFCRGLTSFTVPKNVTAVRDGMFWSCSSLKSVVFAEGSKCTSIGEFAFRYCKSLTDIVLPDTVSFIGSKAFEECTALPYIIIPSSVTTVSSYIFYSDSQIYVYCEAASQPAGWDSYWCKYKYDPYYYDRTSLFYVSLPSGQIEWNFAGKVRLDLEPNNGGAGYHVTIAKGASLTSVVPKRTGYTFDGWYEGADMKTLVTSAPDSSTLLYAKWLEETNTSLFTYRENAKDVTILQYNGSETDVSVPAYVNGKKVLAISDGAFSATGVTSVTIPNTVASLGDSVFDGCENLSSVTFLKQSICASIGQYAFRNCTSLSSIHIPLSVQTIGKEAFACDNGIVIDCDATAKPDGWNSEWLSGVSGATVNYDRAQEYAVTFITNGGDAMAPAYVKYGNNLSLIVGTRSGYTFGGWYFDAGMKNPVTIIPEHDVTVYARWNEEISTSLLSFTENGSSVTITKYNGSVTVVALPSFIGGKPVCAIGAEAFMGTAVVSVAIPDTVTDIGQSAFKNCTSLSSFTLPAGVTVLNNATFSGDTNLATFTFAAGSKCVKIGESAFASCSKLSGLTIPDSVTEIQSYAFENCTSLTSLIIPIGVTTVGTHLFKGVGSVLVYCLVEDQPSGWNNNWRAYNASNDLLPADQVEWAYGCTKYRVTFVTNGGSAIASAPYKEGRDLTKFVPARAGYTFDGWYTDAALTHAISAVGTSAVTVYAKWKEESLTSLFTYTENEDAVTVTKYNGSAADVVVPAYINGKAVRVIGEEAFADKNVTSVTFSAYVTSIEKFAFSGCESLTDFITPKVCALGEIGQNAFANCTALKSIIIPASVSVMGANAFAGDTNLVIYCRGEEQPADWHANWLTGAVNATVEWNWVEHYTVTFVTNGGNTVSSAFLPVGASLSTYQPERNDFTFGGWYSDISLTKTVTVVPEQDVTVYAKWNEESATSLFSYSLSGGKATVTQFNDPNFSDSDKSIKNVVIPAYIGGCPVTDIGAKAFVVPVPSNVIYYSDLRSITLPETLVNIGDSAFKYCNRVSAITIPASVRVIGDRAFAECNSLKTFVFAEGTALTHIWSFAFEKCYALTAIDLPDTVIQLGDYTFAECSSLTSIRIPAGVKLIHSGMFYKDTNLKSITFAEGCAPSAVGHDAFHNCTSLTAIALPAGVETIEDDAFNGCSSLVSLSLPDTLKVIQVRSFASCSSLVSIELPHSLEQIQSSAFSNCTSLSSFVLPNSVTGIGDTVFYNCSSLTDFTFEEKAKCSYVGKRVFENCTSLTSIVMSDCITYFLGDRIFIGCSDSLVVYCKFASKPSCWNNDWNVYKSNGNRIPDSQIIWGYTDE